MKFSKALLVMLGMVTILLIGGFNTFATASSSMYPDPTITAPASFQVAAMTPLQLKVIDSSSGKKYQLHVMDASYEVEVHCGQATKPVMHNHDGLHALHCEK